MPRSCGPCTACCSALVIEELDKPAFSRCPHEVTQMPTEASGSSDQGCGGSCNRYATRPASCSNFRCLWLDGHLTDADRPDRLGVIFTTTTHEQLGTIPMLIEVTPGRSRDTDIGHAVQRLTQKSPVLVLTAESGTLHRAHMASPVTAITVNGRAA